MRRLFYVVVLFGLFSELLFKFDHFRFQSFYNFYRLLILPLEFSSLGIQQTTGIPKRLETLVTEILSQ